MYPIPNRQPINSFPHHPERMIPPIPLKQTQPSPYRYSQANNYGLRPQMVFPSQRVSTVSSQKVSVATKATKNEIISKVSSVALQSPKSQRFVLSDNPYSIQRPIQSSRFEAHKQTTRIVPDYSPIKHEQKLTVQKQLLFPVQIGVINNSQHKTISSINKQIRSIPKITAIIEQSVEQIMVPPSKCKINTNAKVSKVQPDLLIPKMEIKKSPQKKQKLQSKTPKRTITQSHKPALVSSVTVQSVQLPPIIRNPPKRINNRLYQSAVYDRRCLSVRPASRARSTASFIPKPKKKDIYIRCPHRTFISDKKIPVIGSYVSNDKSKNCIIRQFSARGPQVSQSRIIGTEFIQVLPTQIIKMPIGKAQELRSQQYQHSILNDDIDIYSSTSNPILDQPTLIKQYIPDDDCGSFTERKNSNSLNDSFSSSKSRRLSDSIRISVYKSPSVVIKKAETIVSGPKLSKNHVMRVAVEGKTISKYQRNQKSESSKRSSSPQGARYENINSNSKFNIDIVENPYARNNVVDIIERIKKETSEKIINHDLANTPSYSDRSILKDDSNHETMISDFNALSSQHTVSKTETQLISSSHKQQSQKSQKNIKSVSIAEMNFTDYLNSSNKRKQQVNKILFQSPISVGSRKQSNDLAFDPEETKVVEQVSIKSFQSSLSLSSINKHKYKIPKLSSDLEEDLKKLRLENEKKKKQLEDNWTSSIRSQFSKN